jgi:hypothetical protein
VGKFDDLLGYGGGPATKATAAPEDVNSEAPLEEDPRAAHIDDLQEAPGLVERGNVDLTNRPRVKNADGSISTVRSASFNLDGREVLLPTVSDDGRILSDDEAVTQYLKTGKHLGKFDTPASATAYAGRLHQQQAATLESPAPAGNFAVPMGAKPPAPAAGGKFADLTSYQPGAPAAAAPRSTAPTAPDTSALASTAQPFYRATAFGLGSRLGALLDTGISKLGFPYSTGAEVLNNAAGGHPGLSPLTDSNLTYEQRLAEYFNRDRAQHEAHPVLAGVGSAAGGLATAVAAPAVAPVRAAQTAAPNLLRAVASSARTGAGYGALGAAGSSQATTPQGLIDDTVTGTATGAGLGAGLTTAARAVGATAGALSRSSRAKLAKDATGDLLGSTGGKTKKAIARDRDDVADVILNDPEIAVAIRKPASKALPVVEKKLEAELSRRSPAYATVEQALPITPSKVLSQLDDRIAAAEKEPLNDDVVGELQAVRDSLAKTWGAPAAGAAGPEKAIAVTDLRRALSNAQKRSVGTGDATQARRMRGEVTRSLDEILNGHLDEAAKVSDDAAAAVDEIRDMNRRYSALRRIEDHLHVRADAEGGKGRLSPLVKGGLAGATALSTLASTGSIKAALGAGAGAYLTPAALAAAGKLSSAANRALARLTSARAAGQPTAALAKEALEAGVPAALVRGFHREEVAGAR